MWWWLWLGLKTAVICSVIGSVLVFFAGPLLSLALSFVPKQYLVSRLKIRVAWNKVYFALEDLDLGKAVLGIISPFVPLPFSITRLRLKHASILIPLDVLKGGSIKLNASGLSVDLVSHTEAYWNPSLLQNKDRLAKAVEAARAARIAEANTWWMTILQKLDGIAKSNDVIKKFESERAAQLKAENPIAAWKRTLDSIIDNLMIESSDINIRLLVAKQCTLGIELNGFRFNQAELKEETTVRKREIEIDGFSMYVDVDAVVLENVEPESTTQELDLGLYTSNNEKVNAAELRHDHVIDNLTFSLVLELPPVMQGILLPQYLVGGLSPPVLKLVKVLIVFENACLGISPDIVRGLFGLLDRLNGYYKWTGHAKVKDEAGIVSLTEDEKKQYRQSYATLDDKKASKSRKAESKKIVDELEARMEPKEILRLRVAAKALQIPSGGEKVESIPEQRKLDADLSELIAKPISFYAPSLKPVDDENLPVRTVSVHISVKRFLFKLRGHHQTSLVNMGAKDLELSLAAALYEVKGDTPSIILCLSLYRFYIVDSREPAQNAITSIFDINPGCKQMLNVDLKILGDGFIEGNVDAQDFSIVGNVEPLIVLSKIYMAAMISAEDEQSIAAPTETVVAKKPVIVFVKDLPQDYSPLFLGSVPMDFTLTVRDVELISAVDYTVKRSHTISISSNLYIEIESSKNKEKISLQLDEVAVEPCSVDVTDEGISLTRPEINRSLIEITGAGSGPDVDIVYESQLLEPSEDRPSLLITRKIPDKSQMSLHSQGPSVTNSPQYSRLRQGSTAESDIPPSPAHSAISERFGSESGSFMDDGQGGRQSLDYIIEPPGAQRCVYLKVKLCAINLSKDDIALLLAISNRLSASISEDEKSQHDVQEKEKARVAAQKEREIKANLKKLEDSFRSIDTDGMGTISADEVHELLKEVIKRRLTRSEMEETIKEFMSLVDADNSGDVTLEEFISKLNPEKTVFRQKHAGHIRLTAQEYKDPFYTKDLAVKFKRVMEEYSYEEIGIQSDPSKFLWRPDLPVPQEVSGTTSPSAISSVASGVSNVTRSAVTTIGGLGSRAGGALGSAANAVGSVRGLSTVTGVVGSVGSVAGAAVGTVGSAVGSGVGAVGAKVADAASTVGSAAASQATAFNGMLMGGLSNLQTALGELPAARSKAEIDQKLKEELRRFWEMYMTECDTSLDSLKGQKPHIVQQKLIRVFRSKDFAKEAWQSIIAPNLRSKKERASWVIRDSAVVQGVTDIQTLLERVTATTGTVLEAEEEGNYPDPAPMIVRTDIETDLGGLHLCLIDPRLPAGKPGIRFSATDINGLISFALWEGGTPLGTKVKAADQLFYPQDIISSDVSFSVQGEYYNSGVKEMEPFLEPYAGELSVYKEPQMPLHVEFLSRHYFTINCTAAFLDQIKASLESFGKLDAKKKEREHITDLGGLFWINNQSGSPVECSITSLQADTGSSLQAPIRVPDMSWEPCIVHDEALILQQLQQEQSRRKDLAEAFHSADEDGSGILDSEEIRALIIDVFKKKGVTQDQLEKEASEFMKIADTDDSGTVTLEEFLVAIEKSGKQARRTLTLNVEGYEPVTSIPIDTLDVKVYELVPKLPFRLTGAESAVDLYEMAKELYTRQPPSAAALAQAYGLFRMSEAKDSQSYGRIKGYLERCLENHIPVRMAIHIDSDSMFGLTVHIRSNYRLRNSTSRTTEVMFYDNDRQAVVAHTANGGEPLRFISLKRNEEIAVPIPLVNRGYFAVRQVGETDWSNQLEITTAMVEEKEALAKLGKKRTAKARVEEILTFPLKARIDDQPLKVVRERVSNQDHCFDYQLNLLPQFLFQNSLPCTIEYKIVQPNDNFETESGGSGRGSPGRSHIQRLFDTVTEVNARRGFIESGHTAQISGLDMNEDAMLRVRLISNFSAGDSSTTAEAQRNNPATAWSDNIVVPLLKHAKKFTSENLTVKLNHGVDFELVPSWYQDHSPQITASVAYWIYNKCNLPLKYRCGGFSFSDEQNQEIFHNQEIPVLMMAKQKEKLMVLPSPGTSAPDRSERNGSNPPGVTVDWLSTLSPRCETSITEPKPGWSHGLDIMTIGRPGIIEEVGFYNLAYEVDVAASQYFRTKVITIQPRYVLHNHTKRTLELLPLNIDKKGEGLDFEDPKVQKKYKIKQCLVKEQESAVIYQFYGHNCDKGKAIKIRDIEENGDASGWSQMLSVDSDRDYFIWSRGIQGEGPLLSVGITQRGPSTFITITDATATPPFRIDNRSTKHTIRFRQADLPDATECTLGPVRWSSFTWERFTRSSDDQMELEVTIGTAPSFRVKLSQVQNLKPLSPDGGQTRVFGEVYVQNSTRVLSFSDAELNHSDIAKFRKGFLSSIVFDFRLLGSTITLIDSSPRELMAIYVEDVALCSPERSREISFKIHHVEINDMTVSSEYPVVFVPTDTGYRSDRHEDWKPEKGEKPFFIFLLDTEPSEGIMIIKQCALGMGNMLCQINADYLLVVAFMFMRMIPESDPEQDIINGQLACRTSVLKKIEKMPPQGSGGLIFLSHMMVQPFDFDFVFVSDPENNQSGLKQVLPATLANMVGGIAHITPRFHFRPIAYKNRFFTPGELAYDVVMTIVYEVVGQWYKVVGSVEMLGDPVGFVQDVGQGLRLFVRKTGKELKGESEKKGEGAKILMQTLVGAPSVMIGKASNGMGNMLKRMTFFESQEADINPKHLGHGLLQGGEIFVRSLGYGAASLVRHPMEGAKEDGAKGAFLGIGKGVVTLVASPVVGILGASEKVALSIDKTVHLMDEQFYEGTRRPARFLHGDAKAVKALVQTNIITKLEVFVWKAIKISTSTACNPRVRIYLKEIVAGEKGEATEKGSLIERYKTRKLRHTTNPEWNEAVTFDIVSTNVVVEIKVFDEHRLQPKILLGQISKPLNEIYKENQEGAISALSEEEKNRAVALAVSKVHTTKKERKKRTDFATQVQIRNFVDNLTHKKREDAMPPVTPGRMATSGTDLNTPPAPTPSSTRTTPVYGGPGFSSNSRRVTQNSIATPSIADTIGSDEGTLSGEVVQEVLLNHTNRARRYRLEDERGEAVEGELFVAFRYLNDLRR